MTEPVYLDHNATSPLLAEVRAAMEPWWGVPANPSSVHRDGQRAAAAVDRAREQVAALVGGKPEGVVFTSGATEANALFLRGAVALGGGPVHCAPSEHPSVVATAEALGAAWLSVGRDGRVALPEAEVSVLSVQRANHETGVVQPSPAGRARWAHTDATQAAGRLLLSMDGLGGLTLSSHKLGGPPGIGALVLPDGEAFPPMLLGGSQQRGRRAGTVPTALAVGFGAACALALGELGERQARWTPMRAVLEQAVRAAGGQILGAESVRVANTVAASFPGLLGEAVVLAMDLAGVRVSAGAACASGSTQPSPVLVAMGHPEPRSIVRLSMGPRTESDEVARAAEVLVAVVAQLRDAARWEGELS